MSFSNALQRHQELFNKLDSIQADTELLAEHITATFEAGGKLIFMGNGGSAADSQHLAAEFVVRYKAERRPLAAMSVPWCRCCRLLAA